MTKVEINLIDLRERIALCHDFSPEERDLILDCMCLGEYAGQHEYPSDHGPDADLWAKGAWEVLDMMPPKAMTRVHRFMLGGIIAATLRRYFELGSTENRLLKPEGTA